MYIKWKKSPNNDCYFKYSIFNFDLYSMNKHIYVVYTMDINLGCCWEWCWLWCCGNGWFINGGACMKWGPPAAPFPPLSFPLRPGPPPPFSNTPDMDSPPDEVCLDMRRRFRDGLSVFLGGCCSREVPAAAAKGFVSCNWTQSENIMHTVRKSKTTNKRIPHVRGDDGLRLSIRCLRCRKPSDRGVSAVLVRPRVRQLRAHLPYEKFN